MFTRQHYEKLARFIKENQIYSDYPDSIRWAVDDLCEFFKQDNPRFNAKQFRLACGDDRSEEESK